MYVETLLTQVVTKTNYTNKIHTRNMQAKQKKFANASWIRYICCILSCMIVSLSDDKSFEPLGF